MGKTLEEFLMKLYNNYLEMRLWYDRNALMFVVSYSRRDSKRSVLVLRDLLTTKTLPQQKGTWSKCRELG